VNIGLLNDERAKIITSLYPFESINIIVH
jgi:hypothetical protein